MDCEALFKTPALQLLPYDGQAVYYPSVFSTVEAQQYFDSLKKEIPWQADQIKLFGKEITTKRKVAWYADAGLIYRYSGHTKTPLSWDPIVLKIKHEIEQLTQAHFNACLLNYYADGQVGMGWHSDDEKELNPQASIASLSLGALRKFVFKHKKTQKKIELFLEPGSVLVMQAPTQHYWLHRLTESKKIDEPRINLTFRQMLNK